MATHSGKSHGQGSLVGYSPWGHKESDTTEQLSPHTYTVNHRSAPLVEPAQDMGRALRPRVPAALLTPSRSLITALWPFCALASPPLKDKKAAAPDFPSHPPGRTKRIILLALLRGDKQWQWKPLPTGEQFLFTYVIPPPAEMLAAPRPGWVIRKESHRVWLPPSAKRTDLLPALRTNPLPEVSPSMGSQIFLFFFRWGKVVG